VAVFALHGAGVVRVHNVAWGGGEGDPGATPPPEEPEAGIAGSGSVEAGNEAAPSQPAAGSDAAGETAVAQQPAAPRPETSDAVAVSSPAATPAPVARPDEVAADWAAAWSAGDYDALYGMVGSRARRAIDREAFVQRYVAIAERAGLAGVSAAVDGAPAPDGDVPLRVAFRSALVGDFTESIVLPMVREDGAWRVDWVPGAIFAELEDDGCVDVDAVPVRRGSILDRDGEPLAYDGEVQRVGVVPGQIPPGGEERVLRELARLTGFTEADIRARYADADPSWLVPIKDFPMEREEELLNVIGHLDGVSVQPVQARIYPLGAAAAHVTGYVSEVTAEQIEADPSLQPGQFVGQAGIEAGADDLLTGRPGVRLVAVECESRAERALIAERAPADPTDVRLTIDRDLQVATADALARQGDIRGSAVVLDPRDGAVLALASAPAYDPNGFILGFSSKDRQALLSETRRPLLDRAAEAAYPTGSIFKAITFTAAMVDLDYSADTVLDCPQTFSLPGASQVWEDWTVAEGLGPQGPLTLHQALVNSCNTVFYAIGRDLDRLDPEALPAMARGFGLGAPTGIAFFPEAHGTVPDPAWKLETFGDGWATGDAVNLAIGQGFLEATPLQMAVAYAAIANGGDLLQPYLVSQLIEPDGAVTQVGGRVTRGRVPASAETISALQAALRDQASYSWGAGSARVFADFWWPIAGKTGTAQNQLTPGKKPHSWYAAFGPYGEQATIASAVAIESVGEGVSFAAPVTRAIYEAYVQAGA
jgi:penicillin-binding protein 2